MTLVNSLFAVCAIVIGLLLWLVVNSDRSTPMRIVAVIAGLVCLPTGFLAMTELLSHPKPVSLEWVQQAAENAQLHGTVIRENEAIYVWIQLPDENKPRAYELAWNEQTAIALHKAQQSAESEGSEVHMRRPFRDNQERSEPRFYNPPPPASPPKQVAADNPTVITGDSIPQARTQ